ncbi:MAG: FprA family A-type flavoprotein [Proteobacteria bacterium]|nr:FprA family A-type flavoprotein [Desulfobulbaceae bacterium]MBU4153914.1 FprA family A-type flavoprotein [Pseudomonadota bacterium]
MAITEIKDKVYWVGAVDWDIRDFHGYSTYKGTTYNAFLVMDEKITLFDTVKSNYYEELLYHISELTDPTKIDYIVVNHVEMDHSGSLPKIIDLVKPEKVFCSPMGEKAIKDHFHRDDWPLVVVKSGDSISLGKKTVTFLETKMLHWPDSMFSYIPEDKLLISSDAFGQHLASTERFADELPIGEVMCHAAKYYANILNLFAPNIQKLLAQVAELGLEIDMIAPDHGVIWRNNPGHILAAYDRWSKRETVPKALVIYDSMWHSTAKMAKAIGGAISREGVTVKLMNLAVNHRSDVMTEVLDCRALVFGSPTLNNGYLPRMGDFLTYLKGLRPKGKVGAAFGSYGWSGEAVKQMNEAMEAMEITLVDPGIKVKNVPTDDDFTKCKELGVKIAAAVKAMD